MATWNPLVEVPGQREADKAYANYVNAARGRGVGTVSREAFMAQYQPGSGAGAGGGVDLNAERAATFADTEGRGAATMDDPRLGIALDRLQGVTTGQDEPYTQQVQDQLLSRHADATTAQAGSQAKMLRTSATANGFGANDPSVLAHLNEINTNREQSNNAALGDIQSQATMQNFGAREQAAMQLLSGRLSQLGEANRNYNQGAGYHASTQVSSGHEGGVAPYQPPAQQQTQASQPWQTFTPDISYSENRPAETPAAPANVYNPAPRPPEPPLEYATPGGFQPIPEWGNPAAVQQPWGGMASDGVTRSLKRPGTPAPSEDPYIFKPQKTVTR